jgi:hypothetical protein
MMTKKMGLFLLAWCFFGSIAIAATTTMNAAGAIAPNIVLSNVTNLDFGELVIQTAGSPGHFHIDPDTNEGSPSNAAQVGTYTRGSVDITGRASINVVFDVTQGGFVCDTTYLDPCVGTPTLAVQHTFTGQISTADCTGIRCTDTVYVGGELSFSGTEEGRWNNELTITANYE